MVIVKILNCTENMKEARNKGHSEWQYLEAMSVNILTVSFQR